MQAGLERGLHGMCQPLATLQCELELGQMMGDTESLRAAVESGLRECGRLVESIASMREDLLDHKKSMGETS